MKRSLLLGSLVLAGCNLAPPYERPTTVPIPASFKEAPGWIVGRPNDAAARGEWWRLFNDPLLDSLESRLVVTNQNVAGARAAYSAARALVIVQRSALFPTVTATANASHSGHIFPTSGTGSSGSTSVGGVSVAGETGSNFALQIGATWEPAWIRH